MHARDEALGPGYEELLARVRAQGDLTQLAGQVAAQLEGVTHGAPGSDHPFVVDPVPRLIDPAEWTRLSDGLVQRIRALEAFLSDAWGERCAVADGVVPPDLVESSIHFDPDVPPPVPLGIAGPDIVRDQHGELVVLEDNVRTPTMPAYMVAVRRAVTAHVPPPEPLPDVEEELRTHVFELLDGRRAIILADRATSGVSWELDALGEILGLPVVEPHEFDARGIEVVLRRTSEERLRGDDGRPNGLGALLGDAVRAGTVAVINPFGTGVADDKRTYVYVEDLVRYFLGEEPLLRSVPAYDLADAQQRADALGRMDELVFKPRFGSGGFGVTIGPATQPSSLLELRERLKCQNGDNWIAQEVVQISTHPTVIEGELAPRHGDLRPYAFSGPGGIRVLPGAFSRFSLEEGDLVVNASQGGGGRDVWVPRVLNR